MAIASLWAKLETSFNQGCIIVDGSSTKQLVSPGLAGLQVLIESEVGSGRAATEDIKSFYTSNGWDENRSASWNEFRAVVPSLNFPEFRSKDGDETEDDKEDENTDIEDRKIQLAEYGAILAERKIPKLSSYLAFGAQF